jgi:predicted DNA-binding transcriptional regulator YafY
MKKALELESKKHFSLVWLRQFYRDFEAFHCLGSPHLVIVGEPSKQLGWMLSFTTTPLSLSHPLRVYQ